MHAGLHFWRIEDELRLAAFLLHGVVALNGDLSERIAIGRVPIAEDGVVQGVGESGESESRNKGNDKGSRDKSLDSWIQRLSSYRAIISVA